MEVVLKSKAIEDVKFWGRSGQKAIQIRITKLIADILLHPYSGIGKPEALKHELSGLWSREIDKGNRIIYEVAEDQLYIISMRGHYFDK